MHVEAARETARGQGQAPGSAAGPSTGGAVRQGRVVRGGRIKLRRAAAEDGASLRWHAEQRGGGGGRRRGCGEQRRSESLET